jgi:hypothetical protein
MLYRVFDNQSAIDAANAAWIAARAAAGVHDILAGRELDPEVTSGWSSGRVMLDGRLACPVPPQWADAFGGTELELTEADFPSDEPEY